MNTLIPFTTSSQPAPSAIDEMRKMVLGAHRPAYYTVIGLVGTTFLKYRRLHNGLIGAVYELRVKNPFTGRTEVTEYLYGVDKNGRPTELKRYPPKVF